MHSRIFQVSTEPIAKDDYIDSCEFDEHWFTNQIADYVAGCNRADAIEWLKTCSRGFTVESDAKGTYVIVDNKGVYFAPAFQKFQETLKKIQECKLTEFVTNETFEFQHHLWCLNNHYDEQYGFYIYFSDEKMLTLDAFIRMAKLNTKYYIGNVLDYHS